MTNSERIQANNAELREAIEMAENLPDANTSDYEVYEGSYKVTPAVSSQTLGTAHKLMQADVVVEEIPYAEVKNNSGGKTATIGGN